MIALFARFFADRRANVLTLFGVAAPVALLVGTFSVDHGRMHHAKLRAHYVADAAALSAALFADRPGPITVLERAAERTVEAHYRDRLGDVDWNLTRDGVEPPYQVNVTVTESVNAFFPFAGYEERTVVTATASAMVAEVGPICLLALDEAGDPGILLKNKVVVDAPACGVHANADSEERAIVAESDASMAVEVITTVGGNTIGDAVRPAPRLGAQALIDPYQDKTDWPAVGACQHQNPFLIDGEFTLSPGVYCGLNIGKGADVTLQPGIYIIKNNEFRISSTAKVSGEDVAFFLTGRDSRIRFKDAATLNLDAPDNGPMQDLLVARRPDDPPRSRVQQFGGRGPSRLNGVIYQPGVDLRVNAILDTTYEPQTLVFVAGTLEFYGRGAYPLKAEGQAGFISTAARITR